MKILYDHQAFTMQEYGGISRYFFELANQFQTFPDFSLSCSLLFSNNDYINKKKVITSLPFVKSIKFQKKIEAMNLLNEWRSKYVYKRNDFDLFHPTYYDPYYVDIKSSKPVVITFYDLIHEKFKQYDRRTLANKKKVLHRADKIIAISQNSKNDLREYYGIPDERIEIIHLASSLAPGPAPYEVTSEDEHLLFVGSRGHYKNFLFFVKAIAPLLLEHSRLFLYCSGGGDFTKEENSLFQELRIGHKIKFQSGTDESLRKNYSTAMAFIFPSMYEGFGIPLLESMNCGCPIGASHTSSLPEIAGDAALYFNPNDKNSILSTVSRLVNEPKTRLELKRKGAIRAKQFSWEKTACMTSQVYRSMVA